MDILYVAIGAVFFLASWGLLELCLKLRDSGPGGRS
jgi:hypothetical protein